MNEHTSNTIGMVFAIVAFAGVMVSMVGCQKEKDAVEAQKEIAKIELQRTQVQRDLDAQRAFVECTAQQAVEKCYMIFGRK